jgi:hypothetical protein
MFRMVTKIIKWVSIPVLLIASLFAFCAASYEPLVDLAICLGAIIFVQRAIRLREYFWAAGFLAIVVVFTPLSLALKICLLMGFTCIATFANLLAAFRTQPAPARMLTGDAEAEIQMKKLLRLSRSSREIRAVAILALFMAIPVAGIAQISVTATAPDSVAAITPTPVAAITPTPVAAITPTPATGIAPTSTTAIAPTPITGIAPTSVIEIAPLDWQGKLEFHAKATYGPWAIASFAAYAGFLQAINSPTEWGQGGEAYGKRFASTLAWSGIHSTLAFGLDSALHQDPRYYRSRSTGFWRRSGHALRGTILTRTDTGGETLSTWRIGSSYGAAFLSDLWYPARLDTFRHGFVTGSLGLGFGLVSNLGAEFWPDIKSKLFHRK